MTHFITVQANGHTFGGNLQLSFPKRGENGQWTPGEWHDQSQFADDFTKRNGFAITTRPAREWKSGASCYEVQFADRTGHTYCNGIYVSRVRLLRKLSTKQLRRLQVFRTGQHVVTGGYCAIDGDASVTLVGRAKGDLHGTLATVVAKDRAGLFVSSAAARGTIEAFGESRIRVFAEAPTELHLHGRSSADLRAWGKYRISGNGVWIAGQKPKKSLRVVAHDSAAVEVHRVTGVTIHSEDAVVSIDRDLPSRDDW
jgi:hypothetical protein